MTDDIFIGIGGTGVKVAETLMHLSAAGLGPSNLSIGLIDQDRANGNTNRTIQTIAAYQKVRSLLYRQGSPHVVDGSAVDLFKTEFSPISVVKKDGAVSDFQNCLWVPNTRQQTTLADIFAYERMTSSPDLKSLVGVLYRDERDGDSIELHMKLDEGYRGRPAIGASAMLSSSAEGEFWGEIDRHVREGANTTVRFFLAGSVFGGTGAAGFPTVARRIRDACKKQKLNPESVPISGALMLPYFGFAAPKAGQSGNVAYSEELVQQTQVALEYYHRLIAEAQDSGQRLFDDLYVVGWSPFVPLDYHAAGKGDQLNPPLLPEMLSAAAGLRFFLGDEKPDRNRKTRVLSSARKSEGAFEWSDLPQIDPAAANPYQAAFKLAQYVRFLYAWKYEYRPAIENQRKAWSKEAWFKNHFNADDFKGDTPLTQAMGALDTWVDMGLRWAGAMAFWSGRSAAFKPWSHGVLSKAENPVANQPFALREPGEKARDGFDGLVSKIEGDMSSFATIYNRMSDKREAAGASAGLGAFVSALYNLTATTGGSVAAS